MHGHGTIVTQVTVNHMQTQEQTAPHFQQITRALGDKIGSEIDEQDLKDEFQKYLDYGVPAEQAVRTILRHHGADTQTPAAPQSQERVPLAQVPGLSLIHI